MREMKSTEFMTKEEKEKVIKQFSKFVESGFNEVLFTKPIYQHLHLHCGFIAHYNQLGFYEARFSDLDSVEMTIRQIMQSSYACHADYRDINNELANIVNESYSTIISKFKAQEVSKMELERERIDKRIQDLKK